MINLYCTLGKYLMILIMVIYTYHCFSIFGHSEEWKKKNSLLRQKIMIFIFQMVAYSILYLQSRKIEYIIFFLVQFILILMIFVLYSKIYSQVSQLVLNNMCMLLSIGFIMISRLEFDKAIRQLIICAGSIVISLLLPIIIRRADFLSNSIWKNIFLITGIGALLLVLVIGQTQYGAKLGFEIFGIGVQPSEFVKIIFVFFIANSFYRSTEFKDVVITTILAATHVLILVISTDLGAAVILFVVYLVMLYVATKQSRYLIIGGISGAIAAVVAYQLFNHVRVRVEAFIDPFAVYDTGGYQVAQSLFAIGTGGFSGMGLFQGAPETIPVAVEDFIFSAIAEEMGLIIALSVILICLSCYVMFLNIAMRLKNEFYKYIAIGLGTCYMFQVFLTIGGVTKFIPSTGVTLPLISYGGSSLLSTLMLFAIIQGLYILREDEEEKIEKERRRHQDNQSRSSRSQEGRNKAVKKRRPKKEER